MTKKRLIAFMNAYSQGRAGGDMVFVQIAKRLKNFDKIIVTSQLGQKLCEENQISANYFLTTHEKEFGNVISTYIRRTMTALLKQINLRSSDILLGTSDFLPDVLPIWKLKMQNRKTKWVQHVFHLIPPDRPIAHWSQKVSLSIIKKYADAIVVDNGLLKQQLVDMGFDSKKIVINHPGIDHDKLKMVTPSKEKYDAVFMAQLRPAKGIFDLVKIWQLGTKKNKKATLAIIGRGDLSVMKQLASTIKRARLSGNIKVLGFLDDKRVFAIIKASRLFVFPSHEEGFGIAPLEAQALGLPVVAWNLPVFEEIFPRGMIKINEGQIDKFADSVLQLLTDKKRHKKLSIEARQNSRRFDWQKTAQKEIALLNSLK